MNISDLQNKSIIDLDTGKNLGKIVDLVLDNEGKVLELIIEKKRFFFNFLTKDNVVIKWENINRIGEDVILISIDTDNKK